MGWFSKKNQASKDDNQTGQSEAVLVNKSAKKETPAKVAPAKKEDKDSKSARAVAASKILLRPMISEKSTIGASLNKYSFEVDSRANKVEIKKAIEEIYGVKPVQINIINERSKRVRFGRFQGFTKKYKKAIVTLKKGDTIKLYEGI